MKSFAPLFALFFLLALCVGSCKKEDNDGPSDPTGNNDYIEFKLNDTLKQIIIDDALSTSAMVKAQTPTPYLFMDFVDGNNGFRDVLFTQYSNAGITARRYTYAPVSAQEYFTFSYLVTPTPSSGFKSDLNHTRGFFEISRLDSAVGGKIEGTFAYDSLYFENRSRVRQPGWHRVTEGKFRMTRR